MPTENDNVVEIENPIKPRDLAQLEALVASRGPCPSFAELQAFVDGAMRSPKRRGDPVEDHVLVCYACTTTAMRLHALAHPGGWHEQVATFLLSGATTNSDVMFSAGLLWADGPPERSHPPALIAAASATQAFDGAGGQPVAAKVVRGPDRGELRLSASVRLRPVVVALPTDGPPQVVMPSNEIWDRVVAPSKQGETILLPTGSIAREVPLVFLGLDPEVPLQLSGQDGSKILELASQGLSEPDSRGPFRVVYALPGAAAS